MRFAEPAPSELKHGIFSRKRSNHLETFGLEVVKLLIEHLDIQSEPSISETAARHLLSLFVSFNNLHHAVFVEPNNELTLVHSWLL